MAPAFALPALPQFGFLLQDVLELLAGRLQARGGASESCRASWVWGARGGRRCSGT